MGRVIGAVEVCIERAMLVVVAALCWRGTKRVRRSGRSSSRGNMVGGKKDLRFAGDELASAKKEYVVVAESTRY